MLPVNDLKEHPESERCACSPKVGLQPNGCVLTIHNAYDNRELYEKISTN